MSVRAVRGPQKIGSVEVIALRVDAFLNYEDMVLMLARVYGHRTIGGKRQCIDACRDWLLHHGYDELAYTQRVMGDDYPIAVAWAEGTLRRLWPEWDPTPTAHLHGPHSP